MHTRWYPGWQPKLKRIIADAIRRKAESVPVPEMPKWVEFDLDEKITREPFVMKGAPKKKGKYRL